MKLGLLEILTLEGDDCEANAFAETLAFPQDVREQLQRRLGLGPHRVVTKLVANHGRYATTSFIPCVTVEIERSLCSR